MSIDKTYLSGAQTARRYGIDNRSLHRWREDASLDFPKAMVVHGRVFFVVHELEAWEASRTHPGVQRAAQPQREAA